MGRPRKTPTDNRLPPYVYLAKGRYVHRAYRDGKLGAETVLCPGDTPLARVWAAWEALQADGAPRRTLAWLMDQYLASAEYRRRSPVTQRDYAGYARRIAAARLRNGAVFGDADLAAITPGVIRKYMDRRSQAAAVSANRELAFLSVVFGWAYQRDIVPANPAQGVDRNPERPRTRYVDEADYHRVHTLAGRRYPYLQPIMELAYLCRLRLAEVLDLTRASLRPEGILVQRRKGSKGNLTLWSPRLRAAVEQAAQLPRPVEHLDPARNYLIAGRDGGRLRESTVQTAWQRLIREALAAGLAVRYSIHDLKAKGISDTERADQQAAAGHMDPRITARVYDRVPQTVKPSGKDQ